MKFAVIETGGKQYKVQEGQYIFIEKLPDKVGSEITFPNVLLISDGDKVEIGKPYLKGKKVTATLSEQGKNKKITVISFKNKTRQFTKYGHKQPHSKVTINSIS